MVEMMIYNYGIVYYISVRNERAWLCWVLWNCLKWKKI